MKRTTLLATIAIGDAYLNHWRRYCVGNWRQYADACDYDLVCIEQPLDTSPRAEHRSVAWQKCLILGQPFANEYERVVWIDSDILINPRSAPPIDRDVPVDKVGAVQAYSTPTRELFLEAYTRMVAFYDNGGINTTYEGPEDYHANFGLPRTNHEDVVQTGVMVMSPHHHRELFEDVYRKYEDKGHSKWHYEMRPLSHELQRAGAMHWIDHRFNQGWLPYQAMHYPFLLNDPSSRTKRSLVERALRRLGRRPFDETLKQVCATVAFVNSHFLHFAGSLNDMRLVDQHVRSWSDVSLGRGRTGAR